MSKYIEQEAFLEHMKQTDRYFSVKFDIEEFPAADVELVRHGMWLSLGYQGHPKDGIKAYKCSICGREIHFENDVGVQEYAPYCHFGAKMDGEQKRCG